MLISLPSVAPSARAVSRVLVNWSTNQGCRTPACSPCWWRTRPEGSRPASATGPPRRQSGPAPAGDGASGDGGVHVQFRDGDVQLSRFRGGAVFEGELVASPCQRQGPNSPRCVDGSAPKLQEHSPAKRHTLRWPGLPRQAMGRARLESAAPRKLRSSRHAAWAATVCSDVHLWQACTHTAFLP